MQQFVNILDEVIFNLKLEKFEGKQFFSSLAKKYHIHPKQILRGGLSGFGIFASFITFLFARNFVYLCLSVAYPAYLTIKTLNNDEALARNGRLYLSYWGCFALMTLCNGPFDFIISHIPFSYFAQCLFTIWLYSTRTRGAEFVNSFAFRPLLRILGQFEEKKGESGNEAMRKQSAN